MNPIKAKTLISERRALEIALYAKNMELALELGERDEARKWHDQWKTAIECRNAALEADVEAGRACFFDARGEIDASATHLAVTAAMLEKAGA